jgi:hypothetical protein
MNDRLPEDLQKRLVNAIDRAVTLSARGEDPEGALVKVAEEQELTPNLIRALTTAYNKARAVHETCAGNRDFPVADPESVIGRVYAPAAGAKYASHMPTMQDLAESDLYAEEIARAREKSASFQEMQDREEMRNFYLSPLAWKQAAAEAAQLENRMYLSVTREWDDNLDRLTKGMMKVARTLRSLSVREREKIAHNVYNRYGAPAASLLTAIDNAYDCSLPEITEKTAHSAVFPLREPYLTIDALMEFGSEMAQSREKVAFVTREHDYHTKLVQEILDASEEAHNLYNGRMLKEAGFLDNFFANAASAQVGTTGAMGSARDLMLPEAEKMEKYLDPAFMNRLSELDSRKQFYDLALYDTDLSSYSLKDLANAFNQTVNVFPEAASKPSYLRNLMLRNLETGGTFDPFELASISTLSKNVAEAEKIRAEAARTADTALHTPSKTPTMQELLGKPRAPSSIGEGIISKVTGSYNKAFGGMKKERGEADSEADRKQQEKIRQTKVESVMEQARATLQDGNRFESAEIDEDLLREMAEKAVDMERGDRTLNLGTEGAYSMFVPPSESELPEEAKYTAVKRLTEGGGGLHPLFPAGENRTFEQLMDADDVDEETKLDLLQAAQHYATSGGTKGTAPAAQLDPAEVAVLGYVANNPAAYGTSVGDDERYVVDTLGRKLSLTAGPYASTQGPGRKTYAPIMKKLTGKG